MARGYKTLYNGICGCPASLWMGIFLVLVKCGSGIGGQYMYGHYSPLSSVSDDLHEVPPVESHTDIMRQSLGQWSCREEDRMGTRKLEVNQLNATSTSKIQVWKRTSAESVDGLKTCEINPSITAGSGGIKRALIMVMVVSMFLVKPIQVCRLLCLRVVLIDETKAGVRHKQFSWRKPHPKGSYGMRVLLRLWTVIFLIGFFCVGSIPLSSNPIDLRNTILEGNAPCIKYNPETRHFNVTCEVLNWKDHKYTDRHFISLRANETFDGRSGNKINLTNIEEFRGLFGIENVQSFSEAPIIRNVHVVGGSTNRFAGFIVGKQQKHFVVDSCSSSGAISGTRSGGICGDLCGSQSGQISISNSFSTGLVSGQYAGGIAGTQAGSNYGVVNIARCYSTGRIDGEGAGGICGGFAGERYGKIYIAQSHSTGDITGISSGGIVGVNAGFSNGTVYIEECFTTGRILAAEGGGLSGGRAAKSRGKVSIANCYSRGNVLGDLAGGVSGVEAGGFTGDVYIVDSYASGLVSGSEAGGMIGSIAAANRIGVVHVKHSVYNGANGSLLVGNDPNNTVTATGVSDSLALLYGQLYRVDGISEWDDAIWAVPHEDLLPMLRFQLSVGSPTTSPTPSATISGTITPSPTVSTSSSRTASPTQTSSPISTQSSSVTLTPSETSATISGTSNRSPAASPSSSRSSTPSRTSSPTPTPSDIPSHTVTATGMITMTPSRFTAASVSPTLTSLSTTPAIVSALAEAKPYTRSASPTHLPRPSPLNRLPRERTLAKQLPKIKCGILP
eukprot:gb/GECG01005707.1/.p1 GENE.gb/GECG01005707.1/~~gb/GECG01005707.1/.p1  ORF type:complete len:787 (+),score=58.56 gb/GECG01005707.1/:1-2361(+)